MNIISKLCCRHHWSVLVDHLEDSPIEHMAKLGLYPKSMKGYGNILERKRIQILTCTKCGKVKRYVTEI